MTRGNTQTPSQMPLLKKWMKMKLCHRCCDYQFFTKIHCDHRDNVGPLTQVDRQIVREGKEVSISRSVRRVLSARYVSTMVNRALTPVTLTTTIHHLTWPMTTHILYHTSHSPPRVFTLTVLIDKFWATNMDRAAKQWGEEWDVHATIPLGIKLRTRVW